MNRRSWMGLRYSLLAGALGIALAGAQGCYHRSYYGPDQYGQSYGSSHTVCDTNGRNCMVCDAYDRNCRRVGDGSGQRRSWGFW